MTDLDTETVEVITGATATYENVKYNEADWEDPTGEDPGQEGEEEETIQGVVRPLKGDSMYIIVGDMVSVSQNKIKLDDLVIKGKACVRSSDDMLKAVKKGTVKLLKMEGKKKVPVCKIKVLEPKLKPRIKVKEGKTKKIKLIGGKGLTVSSWTTSNKKVARIDSSGLLTAVAEGTAEITAVVEGHTYSCTVTIEKPRND